MHHFEYLVLLLLCYGFPFVFGLIHRKLLKDEKLSLLNLTVIVASIPFILWDMLAVTRGHWWFNSNFITGWKVGYLPIEEVLFFLLIPQACLFIWVALHRFRSFHEFFTTVTSKHFTRE
ncbi:lycopene cyclase domain-containing protein [Candidatus Roizmanbacteria bacterium]|nr:lycopene cyclase domain-containing protein [Candidatus Roizmanbacteria bacterium]